MAKGTKDSQKQSESGKNSDLEADQKSDKVTEDVKEGEESESKPNDSALKDKLEPPSPNPGSKTPSKKKKKY